MQALTLIAVLVICVQYKLIRIIKSIVIRFEQKIMKESEDMQGTLTQIDPLHFLQIMEKNKCVITHAAKQIGISRVAIYNYIKRHNLEDEITKLRFAYVEQLIDKAEGVIEYAMEQKEEDLTNSIKASVFLLNNLGKSRGYAHPIVENRFNKEFDTMDTNIQRVHEESEEE